MTPKADFYAGIGIVVFSAVMFGIAGKMPKPAAYGMGPGGYPMLVAGALMALGAILAVQGWLGIRRLSANKANENNANESKKSSDPVKKTLSLAELKGIALLAFSFWAYVFLVKYLGFLYTTPVFLFLFLLQYYWGTTGVKPGHRELIRMILISVISTGVSWALFNYAFRIILPDFYFL